MIKFDELSKLNLMNFFLNLYFLLPVSVFFYQQRGLDYFQILALESILVLFVFIFEVPTGMFADKYGRKKSIVLGSLLSAIAPIIFIFANNYLWFGIGFAIGGLAITFHSGTIEAFIYDYLKSKKQEKNMKKAMGSFNSASLIALVIAPIIGSYIGRDLLMNQFVFLLIMTGSAAIFGFIISLLIKDTKRKKIPNQNPFIFVKNGLKLLGKNKYLIRIVLLSMFASPFVYVISYLYQPYLQNSSVNPAIFGTIFAIAILFAALLQKYAYKFEEKLGVRRAVFIATILPGILYILMAIIVHPIVAILLFILLRGTMGLQDPLFSDYKNIHIPSNIRATMLSLISMITGIYVIFARLVVGKLADINLSYSFLFMGIVIITAAIFLRINENHVKIKSRFKSVQSS